jgi:hypothetical protein
MDDETKRRILEEARANCADKDELRRDTARRQAAQPNPDPMIEWRRSAAEFAAREEEGRRELRAGERRMAREAQLNANTLEIAFVDLLARHLPARLAPIVQEIADGVVAAVDALHVRQIEREEALRKMRDEVCDLKIELAKLATRLAEMQTDRVLAAMPSSTMRTVN